MCHDFRDSFSQLYHHEKEQNKSQSHASFSITNQIFNLIEISTEFSLFYVALVEASSSYNVLLVTYFFR